MKNIKNILLALAVPVALVACGTNNDDPGAGPDPTPDPGITLDAPSDLQVVSTTFNSVLVTWQGDTVATSYDVLIPDVDTINVAGISCGFSQLQPSTTYTWQVRARRGDIVSAYAAGPSFTTDQFSDPRVGWAGSYRTGEWSGSVTLYGTTIPYDQFESFMPGTITPGDMDALDFEIEDDETGDLAITFPTFPAAGAFPSGKINVSLFDDKAYIEEPLNITANPVTEPIPLENSLLPESLKSIVSEFGDISITQFTINLTKVSATFGPRDAENDAIPVAILIQGTTTLRTDNTAANFILSMLESDNRLEIRVNSTLLRVQEE